MSKIKKIHKNSNLNQNQIPGDWRWSPWSCSCLPEVTTGTVALWVYPWTKIPHPTPYPLLLHEEQWLNLISPFISFLHLHGQLYGLHVKVYIFCKLKWNLIHSTSEYFVSDQLFVELIFLSSNFLKTWSKLFGASRKRKFQAAWQRPKLPTWG